MEPEAGSLGANAQTPLPMLRVRFQPTGFPPATVPLGDASQFLSNLQRYMVRELAVHPRDEDTALPEAQFQTLYVVPEPGSYIAQVIPYLADLPQLYQDIQPVMILVQSGARALGHALLVAASGYGAIAVAAAATEAGKDLYSHAKKAIQPQQPPAGHGKDQEPIGASPAYQGTKRDSDQHAVETLRDLARSMAISAQVLEAVSAGQLSLRDPLLRDRAAIDAIKNMAKVSNRPAFKNGGISVGIPPAVALAYDLNAPEQAYFNDNTKERIAHTVSVSQQDEMVARVSAAPTVIDGTNENVTGTVIGMPSGGHRTFTLVHPLSGEVICNFGSELDEEVMEAVHPGRKVLVTGVLYARGTGTRRNQPAEMNVTSVRALG